MLITKPYWFILKVKGLEQLYLAYKKVSLRFKEKFKSKN